MSKTAILSVRIISDAKKAVAGFDNLGKKLDSIESKATKFGKWGLAASGAWVALAKSAFDAASEMQQSTGAVEAVFEQQAGAIKNFARDAAQSVGLSASEYQNMAALMGAQLKNLGISQQELVPTTDRLITMAADLASMYGGTTKEAVEALSAAFRGETDPIERYAMSIKKSDINARMAAKGLEKLEGEAKKQAETQTLLELMTEQSAVAMGNFAKESDTAAGQQQRAAAAWKDAKAALGEQFLPVVSEGAKKLSELANAVSKHPGLFRAAGIAIAGFTASMGAIIGAVKAYRAAVMAFGVVRALWAAWHSSMLATALGVWALQAASAIRSAAATTAAWVASAATTAATWVGLKLIALQEALASAAAWIAQAARAAGAWMVMQIQAIASFVAVGASAVVNAAMTAAAWVASSARTVAAFVAQNAAMLAVRTATLAMAAAQGVLNAVMVMNPIMLVVMAVIALGAALVLAYNKSETFRNAVQAAGRIGMIAFRIVANAVRTAISTIGNLLSRVGGVGGAFRIAMSIASGAVRLLFSPLNSLISLISSVIGWISRIRFPSPPAWMSRVFGTNFGVNFTGVPGDVLRFMAPPALTMSASPDFTAAREDGRGLFGSIARSGQTPVVNTTVNITVDGHGIVDAREVADRIREIFTTDARARGLMHSAGGGRPWATA